MSQEKLPLSRLKVVTVPNTRRETVQEKLTASSSLYSTIIGIFSFIIWFNLQGRDDLTAKERHILVTLARDLDAYRYWNVKTNFS